MKHKVGDIGYEVEFEDLDFKRYIRTYDNIFDLQSYRYFIIGKCEDNLRKPIALNVEDRFSINTRSIIKQADTIEELCDERVLSHYFKETDYTDYKVLPKSQWDIMAQSVSLRLKEKITDINYLGAIWTDKGLIYVTKMKGILPNGEIDWELL